MTEGVTIEQLRQQYHRLHVRMIGTHAAHRKRDDRRIAGAPHQLAHHAIEAPMDLEQGRGRRPCRRMPVKRMRGVDAVPQSLHGAMRFPRHRDEEIPVRESLRHEPAGRASADIERVGERLPHGPRPSRRGPWDSIGPRRGGVATESLLELGLDARRPAREGGAGVMGAPCHDALRLRRAAKVHVRRVEHDDAAIEGVPPGNEAGALLPRAIAGRIELHRGPAAGRLRGKPRRDVLPGQAGALRGAMVEEEACGAAAELGEGRHIAGGHEPLGERYLQPVEPDSQHPATRHRSGLLATSLAHAGRRPADSYGPLGHRLHV